MSHSSENTKMGGAGFLEGWVRTRSALSCVSLGQGFPRWLCGADYGQQPSPCHHVPCSSGPKDGGERQPDGLKLFTEDIVLFLVRVVRLCLGGCDSTWKPCYFLHYGLEYLYLCELFFSILREISFPAPEGGRLKVLSLRPLFPDEVGAPGGKVIHYSPPDGCCLQDLIPRCRELECHGTQHGFRSISLDMQRFMNDVRE